MTTTRDNEIIERYRTDLTAGRTLARHAASNGSRPLGGPPVARQAYAVLLGRLAKFAATSNEAAQLVNAIIGRLPLYQTEGEMLASAYQAAFEAVERGYTDVIALASPEPPRRSQAERRYSLVTILNLHFAIDNREGWVASAIRTADSMQVPRY